MRHLACLRSKKSLVGIRHKSHYEHEDAYRVKLLDVLDFKPGGSNIRDRCPVDVTPMGRRVQPIHEVRQPTPFRPPVLKQ